MRTVWLLVATAVATTVAVPVNEILRGEKIAMAGDTRNSFLENLLRGMIEDLRDVILNGNDDVPPLDPLIIEQLSLTDDDIPIPGAQIEFSGVTVSNLASFVIDDLTATMTSVLQQRFRIQIDGRIPSLDIVADHYDINVSAMGINLFGAGNAKIKVINPALNIEMLVTMRLSITQGVSLVLLETAAKFDLEAFRPQITGIFNDDGVSAFINDFLTHFVPSAVQAYETEINEFLSETIHDIVSDVFENIN